VEESYYSFDHEAMATEFTIRIYHEKAEYARQAAMEAFRLCDRLEMELSRFVESSSINRLNHAKVGDEVRINAEAYLCLRQALRIAEATEGDFDIGFRSRPAGTTYDPPINLSEDRVSARVLRDNPLLDLGGIGKGFAIDKMAELLAEWEIESALITGGWSSLLALGNPPGESGWPVTVHNPQVSTHRLPSGWAISASGYSVQEEHVRDPETGAKANKYNRAWSFAQSAAVSDALSTVFLVMSVEEIHCLLEQFPEHGAVLESKDLSIKIIGKPIPVD